MKKVVLLFSPGLDSYLANTVLSKMKDTDLHRIYFDCCKYSFNETCFMRDRYKVSTINNEAEVKISHDFYFEPIEGPDSYIPNRNLMFVTAASSRYPDADEIYINSMKDDRAPDSDKSLFEKYAPILSKSIGKKVEIKSLFWEKEKAHAINEYIANGGSKFDLLLHTYSCFDEYYNERELQVYSCLETVSGNMYEYLGTFPVTGCLECAACFRKACALTASNIYIPFENKKLADEYKYKFDSNLSIYYPERSMTITKYLDFLNNGPKDISI